MHYSALLLKLIQADQNALYIYFIFLSDFFIYQQKQH